MGPGPKAFIVFHGRRWQLARHPGNDSGSATGQAIHTPTHLPLTGWAFSEIPVLYYKHTTQATMRKKNISCICIQQCSSPLKTRQIGGQPCHWIKTSWKYVNGASSQQDKKARKLPVGMNPSRGSRVCCGAAWFYTPKTHFIFILLLAKIRGWLDVFKVPIHLKKHFSRFLAFYLFIIQNDLAGSTLF